MTRIGLGGGTAAHGTERRGAPARRPVAKARRHLRLGHDRRRRQIIESAARYFAAHGFHGGTRVLARYIGISQSLFYHYFRSKDDLIAEVYRYLFESRWKPEWEQIFDDPELSARQKIVRFYSEYFREVLNAEWTRIFLFAALSGRDLHKRNHDVVQDRIFPWLVNEVRGGTGPARRVAELTDLEFEIAWNLHASIFYLAIREWVLRLDGRIPLARTIETAVDVFLEGARRLPGDGPERAA
ncbi:MAG: TetR/AcrR family transcriptional regulator [Alphaproteobacteria bacterium]|nr:TetR/AcrR family transcriptional regulator [Alphaproteobacteria bacterium]